MAIFEHHPTMKPRPGSLFETRPPVVKNADSIPDWTYQGSLEGSRMHIVLVEPDLAKQEELKELIREHSGFRKYGITIVPTRERAFALLQVTESEKVLEHVAIFELEQVIPCLLALQR